MTPRAETLPPTDRARLAGILGRLGSDFEAERAIAGRMMATDNDMARLWLARSLTAMAPALRTLADDMALYQPPPPVAGYTPPIPPTPIELDTAAGVIERAASCLRHSAGRAGT